MRDPRGTCKYCNGPVVWFQLANKLMRSFDPVEQPVADIAGEAFVIKRVPGGAMAIPVENVPPRKMPPTGIQAHVCRQYIEWRREQRLKLDRVGDVLAAASDWPEQ